MMDDFWWKFIGFGAIVFVTTAIFMYCGLRALTYFGLFPGPPEWIRKKAK
jgi:hypothetical protein